MSSAPTVPGILRTYALPALWVFALPLFGLWFTNHATDRFDREVLSAIESQISQDAELDDAGRQQ